ncbi:hypothetical protein HAX54_019029 [Datura stramonium]|uniref:Transmembrane protein n=1 Tax=Datura stramonium TaxID=4076 RepID=A0ABS8S1J1_DATST|nr:hypothetical protein [Datura stramonium]
MAKFLVLFLILTQPFVSLAMTNSPSPSPSPSIRKLGKHHQEEENKGINNILPKQVIGSPHQQESIYNEVDQDHDDDDEIKIKHHHSVDKSIFGGGVILGGLATTFFVAIFCYIRATRRKSNIVEQPSSPSPSSSSV